VSNFLTEVRERGPDARVRLLHRGDSLPLPLAG
jgi:hypothetical protein